MKVYPIFILLALLMAYFFYRYFTFSSSFVTYLLTRRETSIPSKEKTAALQQLVKAPAFGQLFFSELISDFVSNNEWENVLKYSSQAIQQPISKNSFSIWYYKATAQCLLNKAEDCERSARIANSLLPNGHEDYVSQLFNLAKIMKSNQKIKLINNNNQIMVVVDSKDSQQKIGQMKEKLNDKASQNTNSIDFKSEQLYFQSALPQINLIQL